MGAVPLNALPFPATTGSPNPACMRTQSACVLLPVHLCKHSSHAGTRRRVSEPLVGHGMGTEFILSIRRQQSQLCP